MKHQTHEQSYIEDGNIAERLISTVGKVLNREKKIQSLSFLEIYFQLWKKNQYSNTLITVGGITVINMYSKIH